jgi:hypothetical protein
LPYGVRAVLIERNGLLIDEEARNGPSRKALRFHRKLSQAAHQTKRQPRVRKCNRRSWTVIPSNVRMAPITSTPRALRTNALRSQVIAFSFGYASGKAVRERVSG